MIIYDVTVFGFILFNPEGTPGNSWWRCAARVSKLWPYFRLRNCHFSQRFSDLASKIHTRFKTWPLLVRNYVIITQITTAIITKKKNVSSNALRIRIFPFLSYSFGLETINTFIRYHTSLENHIRFQTKIGKVYTCFQSAQKPYALGWHIHVWLI